MIEFSTYTAIIPQFHFRSGSSSLNMIDPANQIDDAAGASRWAIDHAHFALPIRELE